MHVGHSLREVCIVFLICVKRYREGFCGNECTVHFILNTQIHKALRLPTNDSQLISAIILSERLPDWLQCVYDVVYGVMLEACNIGTNALIIAKL